MSVKVFKNLDRYTGEDIKYWGGVIEGVEARGYKVLGIPEKADVSIILGGKMENPFCFSGKRVIVFYPPEWNPAPFGAQLFAGIIQHYYHDHINLGNEENVDVRVNMIMDYIKKAENGDFRR